METFMTMSGFALAALLVVATTVRPLQRDPSTPLALAARLGSGALLGLVALFACFGFVAAGEIEATSALPWRIGYGIVGLLAAAGALGLWFLPRRAGNDRESRDQA